MIRELDIKDLAIIDHLKIIFHDGMTVLTGETGAGKSIIIDALGLLAGSRGSKTLIRTGEKKLFLQGLFTFPKNSSLYSILDHYGIDHSDGNVIIQRRIYRSGRNVCRVNGNLVNTDLLRSLGKRMLDIQGQDTHQTLMNPTTHLHLLDAFAWRQIAPLLQRYHHTYHRYQQLSKLVAERDANQRHWAQHLDMLRFQVKDIGAAHLKSHEDHLLLQKKDRLRHHQSINDALKEGYVGINGDGNYSPLDMIGDAMNALQSIAKYSDHYRQMGTNLQNVYYTLQDLAGSLSDELEDQSFSKDELNQVTSRLSLIDQLEMKYGNSVDKILDHYTKVKKELAKLGNGQQSHQQMNKRLKRVKLRLVKDGKQLSVIRHRVAKRLEAKIHRQLASLYMQHALFRVHFVTDDHFHTDGLEKVAFYVRTNPGEDLLPLAEIASGGELSRLMLALKTIFARVQEVGTVVFDEIDTGVSGRVAQSIADKLSQISHYSQVLCITHAPQVAAMADHHYRVWKRVSADQTRTDLRSLNTHGKVDELARMLAGTKVTRSALVHAQELMKLAGQAKRNRKNG